MTTGGPSNGPATEPPPRGPGVGVAPGPLHPCPARLRMDDRPKPRQEPEQLVGLHRLDQVNVDPGLLRAMLVDFPPEATDGDEQRPLRLSAAPVQPLGYL